MGILDSVSFSIIIPTCGRPELLLCLQGIEANLKRTRSCYEIIVSDDSPEKTMREQASRFPSVRYLQGPGRGPAANRNFAVSQAQGKWLIFTDDDCIPSEHWVGSFEKCFEGQWKVLEGKTVTDLPMRPLHSAPTNYSGGCLWSCNFAVRRDFFEELGGFDEKFPFPHLEDVDLRLRIEKRGVKWLFLPEAEVFHPQRRLGSDFAFPWHHASHFYFSRKHGLSLAQSGLSLTALFRYHFQSFRHCRTIWQRLRIIRRLFMTYIFHLFLFPYWYVNHFFLNHR